MAIITLSREPFSGARDLAECVCRHLGYSLVSRDDVIEKVTQYGMPVDRIDNARRRRLGWLPRKDQEWMRFTVYVRAALSQEIQLGNLVYIGNNGEQPLQGFPNLLNVKMSSDARHRIKTLIKRNEYAIDRKTAQKIIERLDKNGVRWGRTLYNDGRHGPSDFDLVIDPMRTSITEACEIIQEIVERPPFKTTPETLETIDLMTIAAEVRARIAGELDIVDENVDVQVHDGVISITGSVQSKEDAEAIVELMHEEAEVLVVIFWRK